MSAPPRQRFSLTDQTFTYLDHILENKQQSRLQVLLCDDDTRNILNIIYSQRQLLQHQVVLVDSLGNSDERFIMKHLHAIVLCRHTDKNLSLLARELQSGNFKSYRVFFTGMLDMDTIQKVANADVFDIVECVEEVFLDVVPIADNTAAVQLFPPGLRRTLQDMSMSFSSENRVRENPISWSQWDADTFSRVASSIVASMLMTRRRPVIRYRGENQVAQRLAAEVAAKMKSVHQSFPDLKAKECVLVITDRLDDPVTPLLTQWTYEAMIHEVIGFQNVNEVALDDDSAQPVGGQHTPEDIAKQQQAALENIHVLTPQSDAFFAQHRFSDYGQICVSVSELVETYKAMNNLDRTTASIEDIRNFMANFPEAKKQSSQVTRHASIVGRLVDEVNARSLTKLSVLEQEMFVASAVQEHSKTALDLVRNPKTEIDDALRIVLLYHLKYEKSSNTIVGQLKNELELRGCPATKVALVDKLINVAGTKRRMHEIYRTSTGSILKAAVSSIGRFGTQVQNVLTQHQPLLKKIINRAYNGTLSDRDYPLQKVQGSPIPDANAIAQRTKDIIVFMIGGVTYEELALVDTINQGTVDNNVETLMNIGKMLNVADMVSGAYEGSDGTLQQQNSVSAEPQTAKILANVTLLSTAMLNSKFFVKCVEQL
ncbi:vacuolar protein-sorting-associated protein, putative [Bodo saltans]|uniref:Vacuolar protein-sorting-associated protein, putative n=1 Tax=Bodo saltans TaxID=75058 RepID=A0A0S4JI94_BODSA|nr:vacuolar protein-sorting-associated protein, putative [Bodo saltans]|eukprot:CUG91234.1 vacuolar protein-sorting-associated protein, putative [Bodo saltans]